MSAGPWTTCPIIFDDEALLVVDKPHGVLSHPNFVGERKACAFAGTYDTKTRSFTTPEGKLWLVHRLDQDTSGVLIAARTEAVAKAVRAIFEDQAVKKLYRAVTYGPGFVRDGVWADHLRTVTDRRAARTEVVMGVKANSEAVYRVLHVNKAQHLTWLEVALVTGRTHQIRVQAAARRNPVVGDDVYGDFKLNRLLKKSAGMKRLYLHALEIQMMHPVSGQPLVLHAPAPVELRFPGEV